MSLILRVCRWLFVGTATLLLVALMLWGYRDRSVAGLAGKYAQPPSQFADVLGMKVHLRDEGPSDDPTPIVLLHGTGSSLHTFDAWVASLSKQKRVVRFDLPGFGLTGPFPDRDYAMDKYVAFVEAMLNNLEIHKCVLAGNSLGGNIAWNVAASRPERVELLVLIDASGYPTAAKSVPIAFRLARVPVLNRLLTTITPRSLVQASVLNVYANKAKVTETLVDRYFELTLREGNRQALGDRFRTATESKTNLIKQITQPTLIMWGAEDQLTPVDMAVRFEQDLSNDRLEILPGVGHIPMEEQPAESLAVLCSFLGLKLEN
ncbi:MAG: alpha/beta hydrolase [Pirellulaceae bacterium]|nr:alpha/beta hydrolase [Pirellulaceae bacterium]